MQSNLADLLRHKKHGIRRWIGQRFLFAAALFPCRALIASMRQRLGIQLSPEEILIVCQAIRKRSRPNVLVFGTGKDSEFWYRVNRNGATVFVEDDLHWVEQAHSQVPHLEIRPIVYGTQRTQWESLLGDDQGLAEGMPAHLLDRKWDVILVDAPRGDEAVQPGRMKSIFFASRLAHSETDVFVHDCNRIVERTYCDHYFAAGELLSEVGRLRHYRNIATANTESATQPDRWA